MFVCSYCGLPQSDIVHFLAAPAGHHYGPSYEETLRRTQQTAEGDWTLGRDTEHTTADQEEGTNAL